MDQITSGAKLVGRKAKSTLEPAEPARRGFVMNLSKTEFHRISYVEWGPISDRRPIICVHGLTRQCRDFDYLAIKLAAQGRRVICPDLPGRGESEWLEDSDEYALPEYCAGMNALIARLDVDELDWVGTSLGGLIGIVMAGMPGTRIRRLVVNDIGPYVSSAGLMRIGRYIRDMPRSFPTLEAAEAYFREILAPYGELRDKHWRHITMHSVKWDASQNAFVTLCDKGIGEAFRSSWFASLNLWKYWQQIRCRMLVLHGERSDLLTTELTDEMVSRNANATIHHFPECGHVPPLFEPSQIKVVTDFLTVKASTGSAGSGTRTRHQGREI